ncbi:MAG TPA: FAD-binding oxidoreductase [Marmoricola sp.]|nr:FAD-binding oxidoreductase [Marmoricola sp.]
MREPATDVVVVGAGIVGAACAYYATRAGLSVTVIDRGAAGAGTTSRGEGNILVSDKGPGPELDLALLSRRLWLEVADDLGADRLELERKGGLVVATSPEAVGELHRFTAAQRSEGVDAAVVPPEALRDHEPHLAADLPGGVHYPQDLQVQPVVAAAALLGAARRLGARWEPGVEVTGVEHHAEAVSAVLAGGRRFPTRAVVNAAGTWGGEVATRLGGPVPVLPRRGFVLVTEPLPRVVRHKVYSADYVSNVASDDAGLETSAVIEGTQGGTVLIGASRERVGFDQSLSPTVVRRLAAQAVRLFPFLADVALMRVYRGFRPYCPDHLPVIGADRRVSGLFHACGHEGAGIGLAPATGLLVSQLLTGTAPALDPGPFEPTRFEEVT